MKTRSIKDLLIIVRNNEQLFNDLQCSGLCALNQILLYRHYITCNESNKLSKYIHDHRPKRGIYFDKTYEDSLWYWKPQLWEPRKAWLDSRIKLFETK